MNELSYGVIFDMDGVLIDSADAHFESWKRLAADLKQCITEQQFRATFGRQNRDVIPELFGGGFTPDAINDYGERKERYYREIVNNDIPVLPGAAELVHACRDAGMRCAVGSSGHPQNIAVTLDIMGIADAIQCVITGHDVSVGKPDPQVFQLAGEGIGLPPRRCAVIEDAPAGIAAALSAGMKAIAVTTQHDPDKLDRAHHIAAGLHDLTAAQIAGIIDR